MDIVEINKLTQKKRVDLALQHMCNLSKLTNADAISLVLVACKKEYGLRVTTNIIHALGVKKL